MKLGFLMIILTLADNGQLSAAFVNTATLEECESRAAVVRGILEQGDTPIEQMACRASDAEFEPFLHGMEEFAERQTYIVAFDDERATVEKAATCEGVEPAAGSWCVTSLQKFAAEAQ
jgi:hypothetical protein